MNFKKPFLILALLICSLGYSALAQIALNPKGCGKIETRMHCQSVPKSIPGVYDNIRWEDTKDKIFKYDVCTGYAYLNGKLQFQICLTDRNRYQDNPIITELRFYSDRFYVTIDGVKVKVGTPISTLRKMKSLNVGYGGKFFMYDTYEIWTTDGIVSRINIGLHPYKPSSGNDKDKSSNNEIHFGW